MNRGIWWSSSPISRRRGFKPARSTSVAWRPGFTFIWCRSITIPAANKSSRRPSLWSFVNGCPHVPLKKKRRRKGKRRNILREAGLIVFFPRRPGGVRRHRIRLFQRATGFSLGQPGILVPGHRHGDGLRGRRRRRVVHFLEPGGFGRPFLPPTGVGP